VKFAAILKHVGFAEVTADAEGRLTATFRWLMVFNPL